MENHGQDRRKFLKRAGTAAAAAPAVATLITATSKPALAGGHYGGGSQGNNGWGNGPMARIGLVPRRRRLAGRPGRRRGAG